MQNIKRGSAASPPHVLVVEDDADIAHLVALHLRDQGYTVTWARDGNSGLEKALGQSFDLILLDITLPGIDGLELCRRLRARSGGDYVPLLMLTARNSELDRVLGLEMGADDYLAKPFSMRELLARVRAILRRVSALTDQSAASGERDTAPPPIIHAGALTIEPDTRRVLRDGEPLNLTAKEFDLLVQFAAHPGRVYSRTDLLDLVWGDGYAGYEHTVNTHINRLRTKIEHDPAHPHFLLTVWGVGYKFADAAGHGELEDG